MRILHPSNAPDAAPGALLWVSGGEHGRELGLQDIARSGAVAFQVFGPVRVVTAVSEGPSASRSHAGISVGAQDGRDLSAVAEPQRGIWLLRQWSGAGSAYFTTSTVLA